MRPFDVTAGRKQMEKKFLVKAAEPASEEDGEKCNTAAQRHLKGIFLMCAAWESREAAPSLQSNGQVGLCSRGCT